MIKEIQPRVWDIQCNCIVEQNLIKIKFFKEECGVMSRAYTIDELSNGMYDFPHDVESCIKLLYTGLKDKNGKGIYEGDIQKEVLGNHYWIYIVKSIGGQFGNQLFSMTIEHNISIEDERYTFEKVILDNEARNYVKSGNNIEVIGNIYENFELLENK